jgi:hypothetical protein
MIALVTIACRPVQQRVETMADEPTATEAALRNMGDNGRSHDLAIADVHFIPHSSEISGLGEAALERFAPWLEVYGGTLRYETYLTDEELVVKRIAHAREYLALVGCDVDRIHVKAMISGGRMITAADAVRIMKAGSAAVAAGGQAAAPGGAISSSR